MARGLISLSGSGVAALCASSHRIVVTGASGWLGMATLDALSGMLGDDFDARLAAFGSTARTLRLADGRHVAQQPLDALTTLNQRPTIVLHYAFLTKDRAATMAEADYIAANRAIRDRVIGALDGIGAEAVFIASSGAAYSADDSGAAPAMRLYGGLKRDDETAFAAWAGRSGARAVIARIFNLSGGYINKPEHYALASFVADALAGKPIAIAAARPVERAYLSVSDLLSVAFAALVCVDSDQPNVIRFDASGSQAIELEALARAVDRLVGGNGVRRAPLASDATPDRYVGDASMFDALAMRYGVARTDLDEQIRQTAHWLSKPGGDRACAA